MTELDISHSEEVPCPNPELFPECKNYCEWQKKLSAETNKDKFKAIRK